MAEVPPIQYAKAADGVHIAYQVFGQGPIDLVIVPGFISHLTVMWDLPAQARIYRRLASVARVITFDKRGTGLSDRTGRLPDVDQRMLDVQAVVDAAGAEQPAVVGVSEGGAMALTYAATYPDRVRSLVLVGSYAMPVLTDDHPIGIPSEVFDLTAEYLGDRWGTGAGLSAWATSLADDATARAWWARLQREAASPGAAVELLTSYTRLDARSALPLISAPTLVVHRRGDRIVDIALAREVADGIPHARMLELDGDDHLSAAGDVDVIVDAVTEFVAGVTPEEPDRRLATVLFTDIVSSTDRVRELGDHRWRRVLDDHDRLVQVAVDRHGGRVVKGTGDGVLAIFDGPTRAVRSAQAIAVESEGLGLEIRAGVHTGEIVERGEDVSGIAVHLAARVAAQAGAGEVLASRTLVDLVAGSDLAFEDRGERELKGIDGAWRLFAVSV